MKTLLLLFFTLLSSIGFAQDFSIYPRVVDDKVKLPFVHESLRLSEFQILSRDIRMLDMAYAAIVPGYIHFKAKENLTGYILLSLRTTGYIGLGAVYVNSKLNGDKTIGVLGSNKSNGKIVVNDNWTIDKNDLIKGVSIAVILSTYLYDWIHGKYMLEKKQEYIRYKYSIKLKIEENKLSFNNTNPYSYGLALTLKF